MTIPLRDISAVTSPKRGRGLRAWREARDLWKDEERRLLELASRKSFVPLHRQALRLMAMREKAASEGFIKV